MPTQKKPLPTSGRFSLGYTARPKGLLAPEIRAERRDRFCADLLRHVRPAAPGAQIRFKRQLAAQDEFELTEMNVTTELLEHLRALGYGVRSLMYAGRTRLLLTQSRDGARGHPVRAVSWRLIALCVAGLALWLGGLRLAGARRRAVLERWL